MDAEREALIERAQLIEKAKQLYAQNSSGLPGQPGVNAVGVSSGPTPAAEDWMDKNIGGVSTRNTVQGFADQAPAVGGTLGALVAGAAATPETFGLGTAPAAVFGAGMGGIGGMHLKRLLEKMIAREPSKPAPGMKPAPDMSTSDALKKTISDSYEGGLQGMQGEVGGQVLSQTAAAALPKIGEALSGNSAQAIKNYFKSRTGQLPGQSVSSMIEENGGNTARAADKIRAETMDSIQSFKNEQNKIVEKAISKNPDLRHDVTPIIQRLEQARSNFNPEAEPEAFGAINNLIERVKKFTPGETPVEYGAGTTQPGAGSMTTYNPEGVPSAPGNYGGAKNAYSVEKQTAPFGPKTTLEPIDSNLAPPKVAEGATYTPETSKVDNTVSSADLNKIKRMLQDRGKDSYLATNQIFNEGTAAANAAKAGGGVAREILNAAHPEAAAANARLSSLHDIEDYVNKNIFAEGKPEGALVAAGMGQNERSMNALEDLSVLTKNDFVTPAKKLAAVKAFSNPPIMPVDKNGAMAGRIGLAGFAGGLLGPFGPALTIPMTSPLVQRTIMDMASRPEVFNPVAGKLFSQKFSPWAFDQVEKMGSKKQKKEAQ